MITVKMITAINCTCPCTNGGFTMRRSSFSNTTLRNWINGPWLAVTKSNIASFRLFSIFVSPIYTGIRPLSMYALRFMKRSSFESPVCTVDTAFTVKLKMPENHKFINQSIKPACKQSFLTIYQSINQSIYQTYYTFMVVHPFHPRQRDIRIDSRIARWRFIQHQRQIVIPINEHGVHAHRTDQRQPGIADRWLRGFPAAAPVTETLFLATDVVKREKQVISMILIFQIHRQTHLEFIGEDGSFVVIEHGRVRLAHVFRTTRFPKNALQRAVFRS